MVGHFKQMEIALMKRERGDLLLLLRREYRQMEFPEDLVRQSAKNAFFVDHLISKYPDRVPPRVKK